MKQKRYDVVIAGAGVAGCLAARDLARMGRSALVVESGGPDTLGHDWWDTVEADIFERVGFPPPPPGELMRPMRSTIRTPLKTTGVTVEMPPTHINIDRKLFAQRLYGAALEAGAEFVFGARAQGPVFDGEKADGIDYVGRNGRRETVRADIVVDATGAAGALRAKMPNRHGFEPRLKRADFVVTWREIRADTSNQGRSILVVDDGAQWVCRSQEGMVDVFACFFDIPGRRDPREETVKLMERERGVGDKILRGGYGAKIPVRRGLDSFVAPGFMLIGDSACMANPMNGSGVTTALLAASIAAKTAAAALERRSFTTADLWPYNVEYKRAQDGKFAKLYMLQQLMLGEPKEHLHYFMSRGILPPDGFWNAENSVSIRNLDRFPRAISLLARPTFFGRAAVTFALAELLEQHYKRFPEKFDPGAFKAWRRAVRLLLQLAPSGKGARG